MIIYKNKHVKQWFIDKNIYFYTRQDIGQQMSMLDESFV